MVIFGLFGELYLLIVNRFVSMFRHKPPKRWLNGHKGDIILVTGWLENWYYMRKIGEHFNRLGYRVHVPNLHNGILPLSQSTDIVKGYIFDRGLKNIIFIAHSKGGIISKKLMQSNLIADRTDKVFTIATPYHGSLYASIGIFNIHELRPNTNSIKKIHRRHDDNSRIFNLYPSFDTHVIPNRNLFLEGAHNKMINVTGHTRILENKETIRYIEREMRNSL